MGHVVRETDWCTIDLDTTAGRVFFQQRWAYVWIADAPHTPWTLAEKRNFHRRSDVAIWAIWSNRARMTVTGTSAFATRFRSRGVPINLDVRWVLSGQHWTVSVFKVAAGVQYPSEVFWNTRTINLGSRDFESFNYGTAAAPRLQRTVAHEFGHAAGNTYMFNRGDEYNATSPHFADNQSIMHTGAGLRQRHFRTILEEMNTMVPNTTFSIAVPS